MLFYICMMYTLYIILSTKKSLGSDQLQPIATRKTTKELVYDQLKMGILNGTVNREEIFTETNLADTFKISRTPIREALSDLISEGLIVHIPRKGFKVREIKKHELEQIFYLRTSIEMKGLSILAKTITSTEIGKLKNIISEQEKVILENDRIRYIELDQTFHRTILSLANQNVLEQIFKEIYNLSLLIGHAAITKEGRMEEVIREHKEIVLQLENNEGEKAVNSLEEHIRATGESVSNILSFEM